MSYIIFVQPAVLTQAGMDFGAVLLATCLSSAFATFLMGTLTNYPIALAPAMGHNFYFAFFVCGVLGYKWQEALGAVFISGTLFVILSSIRFREKIFEVIPDSIKSGIAVGIGLLIALVGLEWAGIVVDSPGTLVGLGDLTSKPVLTSLFGLFVTAVLLAVGFKWAMLIGIGASTTVAIFFGLTEYQGVFSFPPSISPTFLKFDPIGLIKQKDVLAVIFVFFLLDVFDTVGTLVGVSKAGGFLENGRLPKVGRALLSDAIGTVAGAVLGTSTVTSYIESAAGVSSGGRTGLTSFVVGILFILSLFLFPLVKTVGGGIKVGEATFYPAIAPALIIVGFFMMRMAVEVKWEDATEGIPAFLTMIMMPLTFSITDGISFGVISYVVLKLISGKFRKVHPILVILALLFVVRYIYTR